MTGALAPSVGRVHVVMVPGFAGFDALGQIAYYAGLTEVFRDWQASRGANDPLVVLHYFDNLPTAGVATRAARLRGYLGKRLARAEFQPERGDTIALVGHSTGGLDIRKLLWDLANYPDEIISVDGIEEADKDARVSAGEVLSMVRRVAFLSVPQWGTNIADWVRAHAITRALLVFKLRMGLFAAGLPAVDKLDAWGANTLAGWLGADLLRAVRDALREMDATLLKTPVHVAGAHEAASELSLWLRHIASDFSAIDDLASQPPPRSTSPAHFSAKDRATELTRWQNTIITRSYATRGARPFQFSPGMAAPVFKPLKPWTWPNAGVAEGKHQATDITYRASYRACAGGPFDWPEGSARMATRFGSDEKVPLELWDNDGIVNTASTLWPNGEDTLLVDGDHGDIIGHFRLFPKDPPHHAARQNVSFDLLRSDSGFDEDTFRAVWKDVFDFSVR